MLVQAARRKGVESAILERVDDAFASFERFAQDHAGDRPTFESMLATLGDPQTDVIDTKLRKALFNNNALLWGLRQKVGFNCHIADPEPRATAISYGNIKGSVELVRLRPSEKLKLTVATHAQTQPGKDQEPKATGSVSRLRLLQEFCSGPLPDLTERAHKPGGVTTELHFQGLGRTAALNIAMMQIISNVEQAENEPLAWASRTTIPSELHYVDALVFAGWTDPESATAKVYANRLNSDEVWNFDPDDLLPMRVVPAYLGRVRVGARNEDGGRPVPAVIEVPRYSEMVAKVVRDLGWAETEFDLYRCRVEYPILNSVLRLDVRRADASARS